MLNDCLSPGPNLAPDILIFLFQFSLNKIAITVDIKDAFLQIALTPEERNAVKFLWVTEDLDAKFAVLRISHVIFGAKSISFLLNTAIKHLIKHYKNVYPAVLSILNSRQHVGALI